MHYYQFNIGDYQSHTAHLEPLEDIAYRRLLDWCYLHERPLPADIEQISKLIRMRSYCECIASVLQEFFELTENGWWKDRIQKEIKKTGEKSRKASESAKARWHKENSDANALPSQSERNATHNTLHITHNTQHKIDEAAASSESSIPSCPQSEIVKLWEELLPEAIQHREWNPQRQALLRSRWKESVKRQDLEWWKRFFGYIKQSDFLMGRVDPIPGRKQFLISLEWALKPANFHKIIDGNYHGAAA